METDDPLYRAIFAQVRKMWLAVDTGTKEDMDREEAILVTLLEERNKQRDNDT